MNLINWIKRIVLEEHKSLNDDQEKNIRTQAIMQEYHFSLNREYGNTHFILDEE
jgi:hypothetical protein